jgi:hypothetical protein
MPPKAKAVAMNFHLPQTEDLANQAIIAPTPRESRQLGIKMLARRGAPLKAHMPNRKRGAPQIAITMQGSKYFLGTNRIKNGQNR